MRQGKRLLAASLVMVLALSFLLPIGQTLALVFDRTFSLVNTFVPVQASEESQHPGQLSGVYENQSSDMESPPVTGDGFPLHGCVLLLAGNILLLYILLRRKNGDCKTA